MIPQLRERFNAAWTPERYRDFLALLDAGCGTRVGFRNSETPCFFSKALLDRMAACGRELIEALVGDEAYLRKSDAAIPDAHRVANEAARPMFVQVDFGIAENNEPKLVEIQAFPSLYAFQPYLAETYRAAYGLDASLTCFLDGLEAHSYERLLREAIVAGHDPEQVVLLEIEPLKKKTLADFLLTERMLGVRPVCVTEVRQEGNRLSYERHGRRVPIRRIYNRAIVDELVRKDAKSGFDWRADLDVEWAGHPNWYFRISKFSIPHLRHPCVPKTWFLNELPAVPEDLDNYVLKPLYSFAGLGVVVGPTRADVDGVPADQRANYILQERINFIPTIETPRGPTKAEIRVMYIWTDRLRPVTTIVRTGRGKMMGVDHNKDMDWVGASAGFVVAD